MDNAAKASADYAENRNEHIKIFAVIKSTFEPGKGDDLGSTAGNAHCCEIKSYSKKTFFRSKIMNALFHVAEIAFGAVRALRMNFLNCFNVGYPCFKNCRNEEENGVYGKKRSKTECVISNCRKGQHEESHGLQSSGNGICLRIISFGDKHWIEAFESDHINAVYCTYYKGYRRENSEIEIIKEDKRRKKNINRCGAKIQGIDGSSSGKSVHKRPGNDRCGNLRKGIEEYVNCIKKGGIHIIEHKKAHGKTGNGVAHHGNNASESYCCKILCPKFVLHFLPQEKFDTAKVYHSLSDVTTDCVERKRNKKAYCNLITCAII